MSLPLESNPFKRQKIADIRVLQSAPPLWELSDYMFTEASAMNQAAELPPLPFSLDGNIAKIDETLLRVNYMKSSLNGNKTTPVYTIPTVWSRNEFDGDYEDSGYVIPEPHILDTIAENRNGLRKVDVPVRMLMAQSKRFLGGERTARDRGLENLFNAAYVQPAPLGVSYAVEPNIPTTCLQHINEELVEPISAFVS
jgi:hypothetical protein